MTYSILYSSGSIQNSYSANAIDWSWKIKGEWARSDKDGLGCRWYTTEGLDTEAYQALLKHFGLAQWAEEFPLERIKKMDSGELARERRKKEKEYKLPKIEMASDTIGSHDQAEDY